MQGSTKIGISACRKNINQTFNQGNKMAGKVWLCIFWKRHPELSLQKPENTSAARARGFNESAVNDFLNLIEPIIEKYKLPASRIYNLDETDITVVPKSNSKIISLKGKKQVGCLTAAERGELVTAEICVSASGVFMPPLLIFSRVRESSEYLNGAPAGVWI